MRFIFIKISLAIILQVILGIWPVNRVFSGEVKTTKVERPSDNKKVPADEEATDDDTESDETNEEKEEGKREITLICQDLKEGLDEVFIPLQQKVSEEFTKITDATLCRSAAEHCEYLYSMVRNMQKEYHSECDSDFKKQDIMKCDYSANPCIRQIHATPFQPRRS